MNILEAIKERRSVRSYSGEPLTEVQRMNLKAVIADSSSPFGGKVSIRLKEFDMRAGYKPSTYGVIKGATDFFLLGIGNDEASALSAGFRFEKVVLRAWKIGLGTCWIAATFKGSDFERGESWPAGEELRIISPVGTPASKSIMEKITRFTVRSNHRKPFEKLFFDGNFNQPLSPDSRFGEALEMMRLAPSSTNSQPWRALVDGDKVHFYYKPKSKISVLDCGIGLCHFYETEKFYNRAGEFYKDSEAPAAPNDWKYLYSYRPVS